MSARLPYVATELSAAYAPLGQLPVRVVLHDIRSSYNVGAFFRTSDAVGLERLCLTGITARPPHRAIAKTALGAEQLVSWESSLNAEGYVEVARDGGYEIAAVETSPHAVDLFDWSPNFPVCLVFGNEVDGLADDVLARCDTHVRLPMRGIKYSLNVATAGGVVLYELLRKYRQLFDQRL